MKAVKLLPFAAVAGIALVTLAPHAQTSPSQKIGFVDVQAVYQAHAKYNDVAELQKKAAAELKPTSDQLTALQAKGNSMSAQERQQFDTLLKTNEGLRKKWTDEYNKVIAPIDADVNKAIGDAAKAQGFSIVMRYDEAQKFVVYADTNATNLTQAVVNQVKK